MTRLEGLAKAREVQAQAARDRLEDYLWAGCDRMTGRRAAERMGVTERTIVRWRRKLRDTPAGGDVS